MIDQFMNVDTFLVSGQAPVPLLNNRSKQTQKILFIRHKITEYDIFNLAKKMPLRFSWDFEK